jgi:hypothetical protein
VLVRAGDRDLAVERELHLVVERAETLDFLVRPRFLPGEVVGREAEHGELAAAISFVDLLQSLVLWCQSALGGDIDH